MVGTVPQPGNLSMSDLADHLTQKEQDNLTQLTVLTYDPTTGSQKNLATFVAQPNQLGALAIVASGDGSAGALIQSTTAYILGAQKKVDVYRLAQG